MRHDHRLARLSRAVPLGFVLVLGAPAVSSAAVWEFCGWAKMTSVCHDTPATKSTVPFCLAMETGAGFGQLTTNSGTVELTTDWMFDGRAYYFAASTGDPMVGSMMYYGTIKGSKLKGYFAEHSYAGCSFTGKLSAGLVPLVP